MSLDQSSRPAPRAPAPTRRRMAVAAAAVMCATAASLAQAHAVSRPADVFTAPTRPQDLSAQVHAGALTLDEAVAQAEKRYNAKVVKAETHQDGGKTVYELRLLSEDGRVWTIRVDAATGAGL